MPADLTQRNYWNSVANEKRFTSLLPINFVKKNISVDCKILDIGCGYGRTLESLFRSGYRNLIGIDFSKIMLKKAITLNGEIDFDLVVADSISLPIADNSFECILLFALLTCIVLDHQQQKTLAEVHRILKPGGWLIINDFIINTDMRNIKRYNKFHEKYNKYGVFETSDGAIMRHHKKECIYNLLINFKLIEIEEFTLKTMNNNLSNAIQIIGIKN